MHNLINTLFFFLFTLTISAQEKHTISGTVYDKKGNETLIGATIYFHDLSVGTTTNEYGFYSITISKGTHNISVSYLGFSDESKIIELNNKTSLDFYFLRGLRLWMK